MKEDSEKEVFWRGLPILPISIHILSKGHCVVSKISYKPVEVWVVEDSKENDDNTTKDVLLRLAAYIVMGCQHSANILSSNSLD